MRILSRVCACFRNKETKFEIKPQDRLVITTAPDWIADTPLFGWLVADGSIEVITTKAQQKAAENAPTAGVTVEGKKIKGKGVKKLPEASKDETDAPETDETDVQE